ncbi:hypothetical protein [Algoriphagus pacificus]|uniref:Uncharacterized protein n=1 Tax=Algoriphagus pacificus TaxID=2811234 RepID=A0ABS3CMC6_9BACT|nr:hypothetical protein [Algoriphagus pacificus]MBN7817694.1 hypothetical protein [Algoriphagus pacificus]
MKKIKLVLVGMFAVLTTVRAQDVLDVSGINLLLFGGDQKSISLTVDIQPLAIVDFEPEGQLISGSGETTVEAGMPATTLGGGLPDNLWLNFTHRAINYQPARIYVSANMPLPDNIIVRAEIIETGIGGDFTANPRVGHVDLSQSEQIIVYDFGNGYTGDGLGNGYRINYTVLNPNNEPFPTGYQSIYRIGN